MFIEIGRELSPQLRRSDIKHISLLRSSGNYCVTGYKHLAPPALMEFACSIPGYRTPKAPPSQ
jgi:hypothetical protein